MATMKVLFKHAFPLFSILVILSSLVFVAPKRIKGKEKVIESSIFEDIIEDANVTLQRLEALEVVIHVAEDVQDDDVDPLHNKSMFLYVMKILVHLHRLKLWKMNFIMEKI